MKKKLLLLLALNVAGANALKIEGDSFKKALESRGIKVGAETTIATPETGSFQLITIKNDSPNVITYDPNKLASYLEDNSEKFVKMVRLKRMAYGAGALAVLAGSIGASAYTAKLGRELVRDRPDLRARARQLALRGQVASNRGLTAQDPQDIQHGRDLSDLGKAFSYLGSMRFRIKVALLGGTSFLLSSMTGLIAFVLLLVNYEQLSPKRIIQEKITIEPGQELKILLWFKSKEKCNFVKIEEKYKFICTSDAYQAINEALEVEQK